jgi:predicted transcriptional regulator
MRKFLVEDKKSKYTNLETGEQWEYSGEKSVQLKETEPFFLTYSKQILALYSTDVLNATTKVLYKMLEYSEWNTGKVYMSADRVEEIMTICNISRATYHRAIKELINKGIIIKGKGSYTIAENMFWKGELKMRDNIIKSKMQISFTPILQEA